MLAAQFGQVIGGVAAGIGFDRPAGPLTSRLRQLRQGKAIGLGGEADHGVHHGTVAGFIQIVPANRRVPRVVGSHH